MLCFKLTGTPSASYKSGRFCSANLLRDVVMQEKKQVRSTKGLDAAGFNRGEILVNHRRLEQYKVVTDRALSCVGFPSVEQLGSVPNSHGAVVDKLDTFLELTETLSVKEHPKLRQAALKYLDMAEKEAEEVFKAFLKDEDPTAPHPHPYLSTCSKAVVYVERKQKKIQKKLDEQIWSGSSDGDAAPATPRVQKPVQVQGIKSKSTQSLADTASKVTSPSVTVDGDPGAALAVAAKV